MIDNKKRRVGAKRKMKTERRRWTDRWVREMEMERKDRNLIVQETVLWVGEMLI